MNGNALGSCSMVDFCLAVFKHRFIVAKLLRYVSDPCERTLRKQRYEGVPRSFRNESITKYTLTTINTR
jgi:hypothetical protein